MKVVIVEDEELAVEVLIRQIKRVEPGAELLAVLDSVQAAVAWFREHPMPDLAFFDIQLNDGLSFRIFELTDVTCPVIFTTAYDSYALKAFKVNSVDYLLKPVGEPELAKALEKLRLLRGHAAPDMGVMKQVQEMLQSLDQNRYKSRFLVKVGDQLIAVPVADIEYFYGENKVVWLKHRNGRKYVVDHTLETLTGLLDPTRFFRLNRKYITTFNAIRQVTAFSNSRLKITLTDPPDGDPILVSREKAEDFRKWLDG